MDVIGKQSFTLLLVPHSAQFGSVLFHPIEKSIMACTEVYDRPIWYSVSSLTINDTQFLLDYDHEAVLDIVDVSQGYKHIFDKF